MKSYAFYVRKSQKNKIVNIEKQEPVINKTRFSKFRRKVVMFESEWKISVLTSVINRNVLSCTV